MRSKKGYNWAPSPPLPHLLQGARSAALPPTNSPESACQPFWHHGLGQEDKDSDPTRAPSFSPERPPSTLPNLLPRHPKVRLHLGRTRDVGDTRRVKLWKNVLDFWTQLMLPSTLPDPRDQKTETILVLGKSKLARNSCESKAATTMARANFPQTNAKVNSLGTDVAHNKLQSTMRHRLALSTAAPCLPPPPPLPTRQSGDAIPWPQTTTKYRPTAQ